MALRVRELPPLRLHILAHTPNGKVFRWGEDERRAENNFSGLSFSTVCPGGFETAECSLPRKTRVNYQDLTRLSTLTVKGAGGQVAGEYRLEKTPRSSGLGERSIKPQAVGWQAHLDDDKEAAEVYVDRDLNNWGGMSRARQVNLYSGGAQVLEDGSVSPDTTTGIPALISTINGSEGDTVDHYTESWYDAGPACRIASIYYDMVSISTAADWVGSIGTSSDDLGSATSGSGDLLTGANSSAAATLNPTPYRFAVTQFHVSAPSEGDHAMQWRRLTLWGNHGLTKRGTAPNDGLYASDVIANALGRWCPLLRYTTGSDGTIKPTAFIIPQLEFRAFTTVSEILTQSNRFHLWDWAVWEGQRDAEPTFYYNERNGRGRRWRARVAPSNLQETGPQVDRLWSAVLVSYQDVDGTTKTVGPTGSLADATDSSLLDTDPLNPINQLGFKRPAKLEMGIVSTLAGATEVGRQFLERSKELDQSGSAELVGYVTDDHGVNRPSWAVRAGDQISFVDSSDPSYRRVVHTAYDHSSRTNSIDLDSPPEGMDALLEELGASLNLGTPPPASSMGINPELGTFGFG